MSLISSKLMSGMHHKSGLVRKTCIFFLQAPQRIARRSAKTEDYRRTPPLLANSFPKSGTHLLDQIAAGFPDRVNYGSFLSSMTSSFQYRERTQQETQRWIQGIAPGEIVRAHLFYAPEYAAALREANFVHYYIYRDPRDVVLSAAHYVRQMNPWHKLHRHFKKCRTSEEAILLAIKGLEPQDPHVPLLSVSERFERYAGWLEDDNVCAVRFEDLTGPNRATHLRSMIEFYSQRTTEPVAVDDVLSAIEFAINPQKSHTFRKGGSGRWREEFTPRCIEAFKQVAGNLLIRLGYETSLDW